MINIKEENGIYYLFESISEMWVRIVKEDWKKLHDLNIDEEYKVFLDIPPMPGMKTMFLDLPVNATKLHYSFGGIGWYVHGEGFCLCSGFFSRHGFRPLNKDNSLLEEYGQGSGLFSSYKQLVKVIQF